MWKLFITVLAMSDTGSVSTSVAITDYPDHSSCKREELNQFPSTVEHVINGHKVVIKTIASCRPGEWNTDLGRERTDIPPPIRGMIQGLVRGLGEMR